MKYVDEFRDGDLAKNIARKIALVANINHIYRLMEFCGGHAHAISRYGIADLLPPQCADNPRTGMPGMRVAHRARGSGDPPGQRAGRDPLLLCRYDARACLKQFDADARQGRWRRCAQHYTYGRFREAIQ